MTKISSTARDLLRFLYFLMKDLCYVFIVMVSF